MSKDVLYDINEVCKMLGTTSRTLRFYEEKGIITSTTLGVSSRRQYTEEQLSHIRNVLVLRTLGLSVKAISDLQSKKVALREAVLSRRAEIYAYIDSRTREIDLLNEALVAIDTGVSVFEHNWHKPSVGTAKEMEIAQICTDAVLNDDDILYKYLSPRLIQYMPKEVYEVVRADTVSALGDFACVEKTKADNRYPNKIYSFVKFSNLGLKITFVFHAGKIDGLWLDYYNTNERWQ